MIVIMTLFYVGCVLVAFRVIKIRPTPGHVAVAVLVGVVMLGGIVVGWQMSAPTSGQMMLRRRVLQVIPDVREFVSKVHVESNQLVKKGDPLLDVQSDRYQNAVDQATADLAAARSTVSQLEAAVAAAEAAVKKSEADTETAKAELETAKNIQASRAGAVAKLKVEEKEQGYRVAQAADTLANATLKQAKFSLEAAKHSVNVAQSALNTAEFNLEGCTYTSPVDGRVVNWQITEGTPVARWRFTASGTVMDLSETAIVVIYRQNKLRNVKRGDPVEIAFKRRPGQIVKGKVDAVVKYTGEGQFMPSPLLPVAATIGSKGSLAVRVFLDDEELARKLPLGAAGTATIYTGSGRPFHAISKIALRIKAWMYYAAI